MHHWFDLILLNKISILKKVGFSGFVTSYIKSWIRQWNCRLGPNSNARNMIVTYLIPKVTMRIVLMPHIARVDAMIWARRTLSLPPHINLCITKLLTIAPSKLVNNCCNKQRLFYHHHPPTKLREEIWKLWQLSFYGFFARLRGWCWSWTPNPTSPSLPPPPHHTGILVLSWFWYVHTKTEVLSWNAHDMIKWKTVDKFGLFFGEIVNKPERHKQSRFEMEVCLPLRKLVLSFCIRVLAFLLSHCRHRYRLHSPSHPRRPTSVRILVEVELNIHPSHQND